MATQHSEVLEAVRRLNLQHRAKSSVHEAIKSAPGFFTRSEAAQISDDLELIGNFIAEFDPEEKPGSLFEIIAQQFAKGGDMGVESRDIDGDFQQRPVLKGLWSSVPRPSGLS